MNNSGMHHISNVGASFWIEASAGTGKTKVLVDRTINLLLAGSRPDRLLCLTFTKAAAAEMANRIRDRLSQWMSLSDDALVQELRELTRQDDVAAKIPVARNLLNDVLRIPGGLQVQTIHGFCQYILKRFPLEANIQPHFEVMDEQKQTLLREQAFVAAIENTDRKILQQLFEYLTLTRLQELVVQGPVEKLSAHAFGLLDLDAAIAPDLMLQHFGMEVPPVLQAQWAELGWDGYRDLFLTLKNTIRKKLLPASGIDTEILATEAQRVLDTHQRINHWHMAGATLALKAFAQAFHGHYEQLKRDQAVLDYDDLIQKTATLLKNPDMGAWVLYKLDEGVDHILVDEAQDTNQAQWDIIYALSQEFFAGEGARVTPRSLFVVGDSKQSIYSFQGADPAAFQAMKQQLQLHAQGAGLPFYITDLSVSYRSVPSVLKAVDQVFHTHMYKPAEDVRNQFWLSNKKARRDARSVPIVHEHIETDGFCINRPKVVAYREHIPHRIQDGGIVEVWPLIAPPEKVTAEAWDLPTKAVVTTSPKRQLADKMARTIRGWFDANEMLVSKGRPVEPRDIMILVRHRDELGTELIRAFKQANIPVAGIDRLKLNEHILVQDLLAVGQWCLLPEDDLLLATILKGPFFNYTEAQILDLCRGRKEQTLWHYLQQQGAPPNFLPALLHWKDLARTTPPFEFFSTILDAGREACLTRFGKEGEDVLNEFLNVCLRSEFSNLTLFLQWLEKYPQEIKRDFEQVADNVVRILTVHASKGLQAPIVFLPDTTQTPTDPSNFVYGSDDGQVLWIPRSGLRTAYIQNLPTVSRDHQEYQRLLYVAMTRAEDRLYICGATPKAVTSLDPDCWYQTVRESLGPASQTVPTEDGDILRIQNAQDRAVSTQSIQQEVRGKKSSPEWYHASVEPEYVAMAKPSGEGPEPAAELRAGPGLSARERGVLIHKLLEHLFAIPQAQRATKATAFLVAKGIPADIHPEILAEVLGLLDNPEIHTYFTLTSYAEVEVTGTIDGQVYRGYMDRLVVDHGAQHIYIIDFKTGHRHAEIPEAYRKQLEVYKQLVQPGYPTYAITGVLVWTKTAKAEIIH
jgi:ATP-dependent helicase/nuclease subunit A